jgi:uncharacterized protein (DUF2147 family)
MKPILIIGMLALVFGDTLMADREAPITAERLETESELVVQGKVTAIRKVKDETIGSENEPANPVKIEYYEADLSVSDFEKRAKKAEGYAKNLVRLRFRVVTDKRYKGERISKPEKGSVYVVYGRTIKIGEDGIATIFLNSSNEIYEVQIDSTEHSTDEK